jgi:tetratricopeptide (TPR) repeat protein
MRFKRPNRTETEETSFTDDDEITVSSIVAERVMVGLIRALKGKHFGPGEADAYIDKLLDEGRAEEAAAPTTPLEEAQDLMFDALEAGDLEERIEMAEAALEISADCADAFTLLGDEKAMSAAEARAYYEEGVRAGRRAVGEQMFEENAGRFWDILETRPYMRARRELAICLWTLGRPGEAREHLEDLLRLDLSDGLGCRYLLFLMLREAKDHTAIEKLVASFPDDRSTEWMYDKALWLIGRRAGRDEVSNALDAAIAVNAFLPAYLLGRKALPEDTPDTLAEGTDDEAAGYAKGWKNEWVTTPGALDHLRQAVARQKKSSSK